MKNTKEYKLSLLTVIIYIVSSTLGAGLFLKNNEVLISGSYSVLIVLVSRLIGISIILTLALTFKKLFSGLKVNNGPVSWAKAYNSKFFHELCKWFFILIYSPITIVSLSFYGVLSFQESFNLNIPVYVVILLTFGLIMFFLISNFSLKMITWNSKVAMYAKIIPIIFCAIIGFIIVAIYGSQNTFLPNPDKKIDTPMADQMFPILGIFSIIPSLFYSFDGFYSSASIQRNMKEPKKFPFAIIAGLLIIAIIDLVITASLCVGSSDGSVVGLEETFNKWNCGWVITIIEFCICIGSFGAMNGQTKFAVTFVSDLFESNEMPYCKQINRKFKNNFNLCGIFYVGILLFIYLIIISIAGSFFINAENYEYSYLSESERKIYSFSAIVSNWAGILVFLIIAVILLGAIKNEKTKKIKTDDSKCFLPCAWISSISIFLFAFIFFCYSFSDLAICIYYLKENKEGAMNELIACITKISMLVLLTIVVVSATTIEYKKKNKSNNLYSA